MFQALRLRKNKLPKQLQHFVKVLLFEFPNGDVEKAVMFPQKPALPSDVFNSLQDGRSELRNIFGTAGSTAQGTADQDTVEERF